MTVEERLATVGDGNLLCSRCNNIIGLAQRYFVVENGEFQHAFAPECVINAPHPPGDDDRITADPELLALFEDATNLYTLFKSLRVGGFDETQALRLMGYFLAAQTEASSPTSGEADRKSEA